MVGPSFTLHSPRHGPWDAIMSCYRVVEAIVEYTAFTKAAVSSEDCERRMSLAGCQHIGDGFWRIPGPAFVEGDNDGLVILKIKPGFAVPSTAATRRRRRL